ncbi:MAG: sugar-binding domain-containing protein [Bacteroidota bacterium]
MKLQLLFLFCSVMLFGSCDHRQIRTIEDFNFGWKFTKVEAGDALAPAYDDSSWESIRLPHDWSILAGYQKENTAASTGFSEGGIGWYRKTFLIPNSDKEKVIWIEFDGIYNNSTVRINGKKLGFRPNGYSSFSYDLTDHLNYGGENVLSVKVDRTAYADSRWYTGAGIYRDVRLVKTSKTHIPQWGVRITTPEISDDQASVHIETKVHGDENVELEVSIMDEEGNTIATQSGGLIQDLTIENPKLWGTENPNLYTADIVVKQNGKEVDRVQERFGIRSILFDPDKGFILNGERVKLKGVNLHHDVGALGAAATKASWEYRLSKLKSIGVNAIRMAHNPHAPILMEVCDEMGMLVMNEFFDEWHRPKEKSVVYLGDNAAGHEIARGYSDVFFDWAEKDLKDLIRRDFNHPSIIMWSIGNEIEWTFPDYNKTFSKLNPGSKRFDVPEFDPAKVGEAFQKVTKGKDSLSIVAKLLSSWVKEEDTTRPTVCGSVRPSISMVSGYGDAVDIMGFNYRAANYDIAYATYPNKPILGSENWGSFYEWDMVNKRDFVAGMFAWTGFAYLGEAGPWPRKGLEISFFDFAGFKTPRGHFFECLWKDEPKVYAVTTPAEESEYSYLEEKGWVFNIKKKKPPLWGDLRYWEWYNVNEHWNYQDGENIIVQTYTNCEEAELFLNGESLGNQLLADFPEDNIIKWLVPYAPGELKIIGYNNGSKADEYTLSSTGKLATIELAADKVTLESGGYDLAHVSVQLFDKAGRQLRDFNEEVVFEVVGEAELLAVDNGWEMNVSNHYEDRVKMHDGKALAVVRAGLKKGEATVVASIGSMKSNSLLLSIE